jgi:hypothetical protein
MNRASRQRGQESAGILAAAGLVVLAMFLSACSSSNRIGDSLPPSLGGLPAGMPERPAVQSDYPAVHDLPPPRADTTLSDAEKKSLKDDLIASRERAALRAGVKKADTAQPAAAKKPDPSGSGSTQSAGAARNP